MKKYIRASSDKPTLDYVKTEWEELKDGSGIEFIIYSEDDEVLFEELFRYDDVDADAIYDSAIEMATVALSQTYNLTDAAEQALRHQ